jgi:hypothetical protein
MKPADFEAHHGRRPFNPFTIHTSDGNFLQVPTPEFVAHKPGDRALMVLHIQGPGYTILDLAHVVRIVCDNAALDPEPAA